MERRLKLTRRELIQLSGVVAIGFGASVVLRKTAPLGRDVSGSDVAQSLLREHGAPREGPSDADVTLAVFTDYQCPACRMAEPQLRMAFEEDRKVTIIYKDWPIFGAVSQLAARVAIAADRQSIYPQVHHALMSEQRSLEPAVLCEVIERVGGRWGQLENDLKVHAREIDSIMARTARDAFALGIAGTPAFLIGPSLIEGALDREEFLRGFRTARKHG